MITVSCNRVGCEAEEAVEHFHRDRQADSADPSVTHARIIMPEGWKIEQNGLDRVVHCPEHTS